MTPAVGLGQEDKEGGGSVGRARSLAKGKGGARGKLDEGGAGGLLRRGGVGEKQLGGGPGLVCHTEGKGRGTDGRHRMKMVEVGGPCK
jgi:hypothetical protein